MFGGNPFHHSTPYGSGYYAPPQPFGFPQPHPQPYGGYPSQADLHAARRAQAEREFAERERAARARQYLVDEYDVPDVEGYDYHPGYPSMPVPNPYDMGYPGAMPVGARGGPSNPAARGREDINSAPFQYQQPRPVPSPTSNLNVPPQSQQRARSQSPSAPSQPSDTHAQHVSQSLSAIQSAETRFDKLNAEFVWPSHIDFDLGNDALVSLPIDGSAPTTPRPVDGRPAKLAFTSNNKPIHAYNEMLSRLLIELDGVESWGEPDVRKRRRNVVSAVESEASRLEKAWKAVWDGKSVNDDVDEADAEED